MTHFNEAQGPFNQSAHGPKLMLFGDPHGDFEPVRRAVLRFAPQAVILLGDLTPAMPLHQELADILPATEVWFIHGNHDTDSELYHDRLWQSDMADRNLHGRVVQIAGLLVAGLGGIFRQTVWYPRGDASEPAWHSPQDFLRGTKPAQRWRGGVPLKHRSTIFPSDVQTLAQRRADVLVTHEAPTGHHHGFHAIDRLADTLGVSWVVHGHHHTDLVHPMSASHRIPAHAWRGYGVDKGSFLISPLPPGELE